MSPSFGGRALRLWAGHHTARGFDRRATKARPDPAHAVLRGGFMPRTAGRLVQECGKGLVNIKIDGERLFLALPEPEFRKPTKSHLDAVVDGLGVAGADVQRAAIIDVGPVWFTLQLASGDAVRALAPNMDKLQPAAAARPVAQTAGN